MQTYLSRCQFLTYLLVRLSTCKLTCQDVSELTCQDVSMLTYLLVKLSTCKLTCQVVSNDDLFNCQIVNMKTYIIAWLAKKMHDRTFKDFDIPYRMAAVNANILLPCLDLNLA